MPELDALPSEAAFEEMKLPPDRIPTDDQEIDAQRQAEQVSSSSDSSSGSSSSSSSGIVEDP
eukprot:8046534-Lingulodinium_polyedra.AAC.1